MSRTDDRLKLSGLTILLFGSFDWQASSVSDSSLFLVELYLLMVTRRAHTCFLPGTPSLLEYPELSSAAIFWVPSGEIRCDDSKLHQHRKTWQKNT